MKKKKTKKPRSLKNPAAYARVNVNGTSIVCIYSGAYHDLKDVRRLAKWLLQCADWMEEGK